jgi:magnesium-transporting ATPase (P-type)
MYIYRYAYIYIYICIYIFIYICIHIYIYLSSINYKEGDGEEELKKRELSETMKGKIVFIVRLHVFICIILTYVLKKIAIFLNMIDATLNEVDTLYL